MDATPQALRRSDIRTRFRGQCGLEEEVSGTKIKNNVIYNLFVAVSSFFYIILTSFDSILPCMKLIICPGAYAVTYVLASSRAVHIYLYSHFYGSAVYFNLVTYGSFILHRHSCTSHLS